jgi:hypothetical protein
MLILIWRLVDFTYETVTGGFGMTRIGFEIFGLEAALMELVIILACILLIWKAVTRLGALLPPDLPL